jgi:multiple sugar transport system substrate-binding protein
VVSRRQVLSVGVGVTAATILTGCGGVGAKKKAAPNQSGPTDSGSLTTQGFGGDDDVGKARVKAFRDAYPNVKLTVTTGSFDPQQFLSAVASGNPPDLVYMDRQILGTYAAKGAVVPLDDLIADAGIDMKQYQPGGVQEVTLGGKVYGIPEFYDSRVVLVCPPVLQSAGLAANAVSTTDWNALQNTARTLFQSSGGKVTRIGFDPKLPEFLPLWAKANGADLLHPDGSPNLDDAKIIEALQFGVSLINEQAGWSKFKAFRDTWDFFGAKNEFNRSEVGAFPMEGWYLNVLVQTGAAARVTAVSFTDRSGAPISWETGSAWAIPKGSSNPRVAIRFAKTLTSTDTWLKAAAGRQATDTSSKQPFTGLFTGNADADAKIKAQYVKPTGSPGVDAAIAAYYTGVEKSFAVAGSRAGNEIRDVWQGAVNKVLAGQSDAAGALKAAQSAAQSAYNSAGG